MKKRNYFFAGGVLAILLACGSIYFLQPSQHYIHHADSIANLDAGYDLPSGKMARVDLLQQKHELLPHLRYAYCRCACSRPEGSIKKRKAFLQQQTSHLPTLLEEAAQTQSRLGSFLSEFAENYPDSRTYIPGIKGQETIRNLLQTRWDGDASMITDYSRATISFPTLEMMYQGLEDLKKSGLIILQITDNFLTPCLGGYRDINLTFRDFSNGHLGELQLNINSIMDFKNGLGTDLFHVIRTLLAIPSLENRPLSNEEQICLDWLFEKERLGYEAALKKASR